MPRKQKTPPSSTPWALTDFGLVDVAEVEMQADPHRIYFGFRLVAGPTIWLHVVHGGDGFKVYVDQERTERKKVGV